MNKYIWFSVVVQYHYQPPMDTKAFRPIKAKEFMPGATLSEVWNWVALNADGCQIESVTLTKPEIDDA